MSDNSWAVMPPIPPKQFEIAKPNVHAITPDQLATLPTEFLSMLSLHLDVQAKLNEAVQQNIALNTQLSQAKQSCSSSETRITQLEKSLIASQSRHAETKLVLKSLQDNHQTVSHQVEGLMQEKQTLMAKITGAERSLEDWTVKYKAKASRVEFLLGEVGEEKGKVNRLEAHIRDLERVMDKSG
jgi:chromosome segregation ATPase